MLRVFEKDLSEMEDNLTNKDVYTLCRLCLSDQNQLLDVFVKHHSHEDHLLLSDKILDSIAIEMEEADQLLPSRVCTQCCEFIEKIYSFKQKCLAADSILRRRVKPDSHHKVGGESSSAILTSGHESHIPKLIQSHEEALSAESDIEVLSCVTQSALLESNSEDDLKYDPEMLDIVIKEEEDELDVDEFNEAAQEKLARQSQKRAKRVNLDSLSLKTKLRASSKKYVCQSCGKIFRHKYSLKRHLFTHSEKTSSCLYCNKIFRNHESRRRHEKLHFEKKPYQCHMCEKSYTSRTSHAAHVRKHTGERPFKCSHCAETFYLISSFERHVAKHTGVKEYVCEICSASFWVSDDLRAHVNRIH